MCRTARSAHGRISTALSARAFPHDSADPSPAGPGRMCSTAPARPMPHIRARRPRPDTADPHPPHTRPPAPSHRSRPTPGFFRRERLGDPERARRSIRWTVAGFASTSLNPRARTSSRRARGLSDVLVGRGARRPDVETCTSHSRCAFCSRERRLELHFRVRSAPLGVRGRPPRSPSDPWRPFRGPRRRRLSKSVAKSPIAPRCTKRIVDIPRFFSPPIPARSAFATDSDMTPPHAPRARARTGPTSQSAGTYSRCHPRPHRHRAHGPRPLVRKAQLPRRDGEGIPLHGRAGSRAAVPRRGADRAPGVYRDARPGPERSWERG